MQEKGKIVENSQNQESQSKPRDTRLDVYRALVMIYILCVVHVGYWLDALGQPIASLILFEMPVIFFISGAAISVSGKHQSLPSIVVNRVKRVLAPYYVLAAAVCIFALLIICCVPGHEMFKQKLLATMPKAIWPTDDSLPVPYTWHLWFVTPYLIISCMFCFYQKLADKSNRYIFLCILLGICALTQVLTNNMLIRNVIFYNFFFAAGYLCYKRLNIKQMACIGIGALLLATTLYECCWKGAMQLHKFPPDMLFTLYGIVALSVWGIIFSKITIPQNKLLYIWNTNEYTIYLWQNIAFTIFVYGTAIIMGPEVKMPAAIDFMFKSASIFIIATALSFVAVPLERTVISHTSRLIR